MMERSACLAFACALLFGLDASGQSAPDNSSLKVPAGKSVQSVRQAGKADFTALGEANLKASDANAPLVSGGVEVDPAKWPATLISQPSGCTATFVGPRAILTAAHCVTNGQEVMVFIAKRTRKAVCQHHPDYSADYDSNSTPANWNKTSADYALCLVTPEDAVSGVTFEMIGAGDGPKKGHEIRLLGFGCNGKTISPDGYGVLRTAAAKVIEVPAPTGPNYFITDWQGTESFKDAVGGALCPGDSGGAVYWPFEGGPRRIIGVNSRTQTKGDQAQTLTGISYLSSTMASTASSFFLGWAKVNNVDICGITAGAQGCLK